MIRQICAGLVALGGFAAAALILISVDDPNGGNVSTVAVVVAFAGCWCARRISTGDCDCEREREPGDRQPGKP